MSIGSVNVIIARRLPHNLFSVAVFLVDLFKLGLKDSFGSERVNGPEFNESYESIIDGFASEGVGLSDIDISEAKKIIGRGLRIAAAVGTPPVDKGLLETVGTIDESAIRGSLYKCYECGEGELSEETCGRILEVARKELALGVAGTPKERILWMMCDSCKDRSEKDPAEDKAEEPVVTDVSLLPKKDKGPSLKEMNRVLDAIMLYYNYFIPVHEDGRTPAEAYGDTPPKWVGGLVSKYKEGKLEGKEAEMNRRSVSDFPNYLTASLMKDIFENGGVSDRAKVVMLILEELKDKKKRKEYESPRKPMPAARDSPTGGGRKPPGITIPFVTMYEMADPADIRERFLEYSRNGRSEVDFYDKKEMVALIVDDDGTMDAFVEESGTKLGTLRVEDEFLFLSSMAEERNDALCRFAAGVAGKGIELVEKVRDFKL